MSETRGDNHHRDASSTQGLRQRISTALTQALIQTWNGQGGWGQAIVVLLLPVSWAFAGLVAIRRALYQHGFYKQETLPVPVIVVGNVMVGGVGKTPITMASVSYTHLTLPTICSV